MRAVARELEDVVSGPEWCPVVDVVVEEAVYEGLWEELFWPLHNSLYEDLEWAR